MKKTSSSVHQNSAPADNSPEARAKRISAGVKNGDAKGAALAMSGWPQKEIDATFALLLPADQTAILAVWPE